MSIFKQLTDQQKAHLDKYTPNRKLLEDWYKNATMTAGHGYSLSNDLSTDIPFWPISLMPYIKNYEWSSMNTEKKNRALIKASIGYLRTTDTLEPEIIIPVCQQLASAQPSAITGFYLPEDLGSMLLQVKTDESLHEAISHALLLETGFGSECPVPQYQLDLKRIMDQAILEGLDPDIVRLLFACITERSITKFLGYATNPTVHYNAGLKASICAHELDERRHAVIFGALFNILFYQLTEDYREAYASLIPPLLSAFLSPDKITAQWVLSDFLSTEESLHRIDETYPEAEIKKSIIQDGRALLRLVERQGLFHYPKVKHSFVNQGMKAAIPNE